MREASRDVSLPTRAVTVVVADNWGVDCFSSPPAHIMEWCIRDIDEPAVSCLQDQQGPDSEDEQNADDPDAPC